MDFRAVIAKQTACHILVLVPTLRVGTSVEALRVEMPGQRLRLRLNMDAERPACIPTQSVGTRATEASRATAPVGGPSSARFRRVTPVVCGAAAA